MECEHFAQLNSTPEKWLHDSFVSEPIADGIRKVTAKPSGGANDESNPREDAAYYFDCDAFSEGQAQDWLHDQGITAARFTPAKQSTYPQLTS